MNQTEGTVVNRAISNNQTQNASVEYFIKSKVSNFEKYTLTYQKHMEDTGLTTYVYSYCIDDVNTDDYIFVIVNSNNQIVSYGLPNEGEFDSIEVDKVNWDETNTYLEQILQEKGIIDYQVVDKCIVNENDVLSMRYSVKYIIDSSEDEYWDEFIVPLIGV